MQAWANVKVKDEASEHFGRAGIVQSSSGTSNEVKLDENDTHQEGIETFEDDQLTFLSQG